MSINPRMSCQHLKVKAPRKGISQQTVNQNQRHAFPAGQVAHAAAINVGKALLNHCKFDDRWGTRGRRIKMHFGYDTGSTNSLAPLPLLKNSQKLFCKLNKPS